jgi:hypothetical protein
MTIRELDGWTIQRDESGSAEARHSPGDQRIELSIDGNGLGVHMESGFVSDDYVESAESAIVPLSVVIELLRSVGYEVTPKNQKPANPVTG